MLTIIVARAKNGAIGKGNDIPWYAPEDLAFFKRETLGGAVIMGRNTWESLPFKPLKNRDNIVVSSSMEGDHVVPSFAAALARAWDQGHARSYAMGGASIYREALAHAERLLITEVDLEIPDADVFFPEFDPAEFRLISTRVLRAAEPRCTLTEWLRIR
ncbi:dihydrofolate reductase [Falsigemmobacter faecalis]|uniref:dihydrofolate reductase n=1 Tax=Falsigemmobacter faecalis TaxID=2488730 RepID=A0A3P3DHV3_9RHOB|nr:dihydrofolate reductase [Falsigemmobacter faecalis]RRH73837.1 dihydrofolate reductase [Falsigemmobacter faecalis]